MNIKIIGYNCSNGMKLKKNVSKLSGECDVDLELLEGDEYLNKYNIKNIPALIINLLVHQMVNYHFLPHPLLISSHHLQDEYYLLLH